MLDFDNSLVVMSLFLALIARESRVRFLVKVIRLFANGLKTLTSKNAPFAKNRAR